MSELTVLVTGCGAPGFPGTRWSLHENGVDRDVRVVGTDVRTEQAGRHLADGFHQVPPADDEGFVDELVDVCTTESVDVVLPQVTRELPVLSARTAAFERVDAAVAVSGADAIARANDKKKLIEVCEEVGVPAPETYAAETIGELEAACDRLGYPETPVVVKPPASNGSRGVRIFDEDRDRKRAFYEEKPTGLYSTLGTFRETMGESFPRLLVMEHLPGAEFTVDAFHPPDGGEPTVAIPRRRDEVRGGISFRNTVTEHGAIISHAERLARELDLSYAFGFQFKLDGDGTPKILECNPRIQGTMVTSTLADANVTYAAAASAAGEPVPSFDPAWDRSFYRYWGGIGTADDEVVGNIGEQP
ncbi:ATP-grasp domain-containing protein [Halorarum halobium]|uniref:ATP-grasp domain-containing protein n=1 Tax=Halorarum halobium TaxID=3075121 RepID=UPI0028ADE259|nr:ATP-grasp domain-containing protein [Halobaculum sp. XH14]